MTAHNTKDLLGSYKGCWSQSIINDLHRSISCLSLKDREWDFVYFFGIIAAHN
uniref:Uncharacterized protein n=1 Tax=Lepeophtheirus salmonis TaxID=72036 RepID=A0A0K2VBR0_LEPSM